MSDRKLIVTHHAPDLDAIGAVWVLKRFDAQHFADAKVAFVNPGSTINEHELKALEVSPDNVVHVDTGLGEFDHHQPERGHLHICATSLVRDHVLHVHPDLEGDQALSIIADYVTEIDHFEEIHWPDAASYRYSFQIHELIGGLEFTDPHTDESQLHFGFQCLDSAYGIITQQVRANEIINEKGVPFTISEGKCLALETKNDETVKLAQKAGHILVIRKDPDLGNIRIKVRPDAKLELRALADAILAKDTQGDWYYHPSGKMFLNGSTKNKDQKATKLSLQEIIDLTQQVLGK